MPDHLVAAGAATAAKTNNFLVPNATFIVELVIFFVILYLLRKRVVPIVSAAMSKRQEVIRKSLADGREAKERLEAAEAEYQAALLETRTDAARIRDEARAQGQAIIDEMRTRAQEEAERVAAREQARLAAERQQVVAQLRTEVGTIAVDLASRIVGESLTDDARQRRVVERFIADLEASSPSMASSAGSDSATSNAPVVAG